MQKIEYYLIFFKINSNKNASEGLWVNLEELFGDASWNINFFKTLVEIKTIENCSKYQSKKLERITKWIILMMKI